MDDEIPEFGDVEGLTRLYEEAVMRIRAMDIEPEFRDAWLAEIKGYFELAIGGAASRAARLREQ